MAGLGGLHARRKPIREWCCPLLEEEFEIGKQIGKGTYSSVFKARRKKAAQGEAGEFVAVKRFAVEKEREGFPITALREIRLLSRLHHCGVARLIDVRCDLKRSTCLVMEYCEHDLQGMIDKKVPLLASQVKCILRQILEALTFVHSKGIMHRDIKGANILLNKEGEVKLVDFGLARQVDSGKGLFTNRVVTAWYRCPELLLGKRDYGISLDLWSVGCVFAEMVTGKPLFPADSEAKLLKMIIEKCGTPTEEHWEDETLLEKYRQFESSTGRLDQEFENNSLIDGLGVDLLKCMLCLNPAKRISAARALNHPYFSAAPLPCEASLLPKIPVELHEYQVKLRKQNKRLAKYGTTSLEPKKRGCSCSVFPTDNLEPASKIKNEA